MGKVFLVTDGADEHRRLALKICSLPDRPAGWGEGGLERFRREFLTLAQLHHPNLPHVRDFGIIPARGSWPQRWFFTYDFVEGANILTWSRDQGAEALLEVAQQLTSALSFLHSRGLLHLDIKPANVIVQSRPSGPLAKLIDFGIVRDTGDIATGQTSGTLPYVAPELLRGEVVGPGADYFSLGVTLFESLFRVRPFAGESVAELRAEQAHSIPAPPPGWDSRGSEKLEGLIWRLLSRDPALRVPELAVESKELTDSLSAYVLSNRPVGMEKPLENLFGVYRAMSRGLHYPSVLLVEGEAGSGKTRLVSEFKDMVQISGGRVLWIPQEREGSERSGSPAALAEALKTVVGRRSKAATSFDRRTRADECYPLWESEYARVRRQQTRLKHCEAMWNLLRAAVGTRPLVLVVEDVHLWDGASAMLLSYLGRNIHLLNSESTEARAGRAKVPATLCLTYRLEESPGRISWIESLASGPFVTRERLRPLSKAQVRFLLKSLFGPKSVKRDLVHSLYASSRGNPFVLVETLKALLEERAIVYRPGRSLELRDSPKSWHLPGSVKELLRARWERLSESERRLAAYLSLIPGHFTRATACEIASESPHESARMLGRLTDRLILTRIRPGKKESFVFAHSHLQDLARASLSPTVSRRVYRKLATLREKTGADSEELAFLFVEAQDGEKAIRYATDAATRMGEPGSARRLQCTYEKLLEILPEKDPRRLDVTTRLAEARSLVGDHDGAVRLLESSLQGPHDRGDPRAFAHRLALLAGESFLLRKLDRARIGFQEAARLLQEQPEARPEWFRARLGMCRVEIETGTYAAADQIARDCLKRSAELPAGPERDFLECTSLSHIGSLHVNRGEFDAAIEAYQRGYDLLRPQEDSVEKGGLCCNLANLHAAQGEYDKAIRFYQRARRVAERIGATDLEVLVNANLGLQYLYRCDLSQAEAAISRAVRVAEGIDARRYLTFARLCMGTISVRRGNLEEAITVLQKELKRSRADQDHYLAFNLCHQLVIAFLERGELSRALSLARSSRSLAEKANRPKSRMESYLVRGAVHLYLGDHARAIRHLEAARDFPAGHHPHTDAEVHLYLGLAHLRSGAAPKGQELLQAALDSFRALKIPMRVCECRAYLSTAINATGHFREARRLSDQAWRFFRRFSRSERPVKLWADILIERARLLLPHLESGSPDLLDLLHELAEARETLCQRGVCLPLWQVVHQLAIVHQALGNEKRAETLVAEARETLEELCSGLPPTLASRFRQLPESVALGDADSGMLSGNRIHEGSEAKSGREVSGGRSRRLEKSYETLLRENRRLRATNEKLRARVATQRFEMVRSEERTEAKISTDGFCGLVGTSAVMKRLWSLVEKVAASDVPVLVYGETGTGKALVARAIHQLSPRRRQPFLKEALTAIPEGLIESELFGHTENAFSGADKARIGRLAAAGGGTLCLSEVDELPLETQAKLLRVLETGEVRPLGSSAGEALDFRLVVSSRVDLLKAVNQGRLRKDLFFRVRGVELVVPPLRERREDIPLLVDHFLGLEAERSGRRPRIAADALRKMMEYDWPGNVRELENEIRRLAILGSGRIRAGDLVTPVHRDIDSTTDILRPGTLTRLSWTQARNALDKAYFLEALKKCRGNLKAVARELGVHERTVYKIRKRLQIDR